MYLQPLREEQNKLDSILLDLLSSRSFRLSRFNKQPPEQVQMLLPRTCRRFHRQHMLRVSRI
jgi:hypothetical protein